MNGFLVLSSDETRRICKRTEPLFFDWKTNEDLGNLTSYLTKVPSINGTKIYYNESGHYFFVELIKIETEYVLKMMKIFELNVRRYRTCTMRSRNYFLFETFPNHEYFVKTKENIPRNEKIVRIFHWILGLKGKVLFRTFEDEFFSCGPYIVDYPGTILKKAEIDRLFENKNEMRSFSDMFLYKMDDIRMMFGKKNRAWFVEISKRVRLLS